MDLKIEHEFFPEHNYVRFTVSGRLDLRALLGASRAATTSPEFVVGMNAVWDLREAEHEHLSYADIESLGDVPARGERARGRAIIAMVVRDELGFGLARMFQGVVGKDYLEYYVTKSMPEALEKIGAPR